MKERKNRKAGLLLTSYEEYGEQIERMVDGAWPAALHTQKQNAFETGRHLMAGADGLESAASRLR
jgi:hypothetical protein